MSLRFMSRPLLAAWLVAMAGAALAAEPGTTASAAPRDVTGTDRVLVFDSRVAVPERQRQLRLSDIDQETADIVRDVNRRPGTWQLYLLYTAEDLPERFFHPGFPIRLSTRKSRLAADARAAALASDESEPATSAAPPPGGAGTTEGSR